MFPTINLITKVTFKMPTLGLKYKVFYFGKQRHAADFVKNCKAVSKFIEVRYKHGGSKMFIPNNNMDKPGMNVPESPEDTVSRVDIFVWKNKYK